MKVFISWSGEFSRKVAERLSTWIQIIIQTVDVFYSPEDIEKGENWGNRLSKELEESNFGVICLTPENVLAPWVHFEAGALSKATDSRVSAIMLGITPSDIKGPLARLQNTACNREDLFRLFQSINNSSDSPLKPEILKNAFDNSCERLMSDIDAIIKYYTSRPLTQKAEKDKHEERNSNGDAIQEILRIVRNLDNVRNTPLSTSDPIPISKAIAFPSTRSYDGIRLSCPEEHVDRVLPLIRKYNDIADSELLRLTESTLKQCGRCYLTVSKDQIASLKMELRAISPEAQIQIER